MSKLVTFGEIMCRLNPPGYLTVSQADSFNVSFAGGEANVAVAVANLGGKASFVTKLPDNDLTKHCIRILRGYGVDTENIVLGGERMGVYFVEKGASQRPSKVTYDRKYSSISKANTNEFNWANIFQDADYFHFTGITPALGAGPALAALDACRTAKEMGLTVSCDLNYRKKLWSSEEAEKTMSRLMPYVDVLIANEEDADKVFGIRSQGSDVDKGMLDKNGYVSVARQLVERFGFKAVAITLRGSISASDNTWAGMLYKEEQAYFSREYLIHLVDRVGGGDSFSGGLVYAMMEGYEPQDCIEFATAVSCLKQATEFDFSQSSLADVRALLSSGGTGRVQR